MSFPDFNIYSTPLLILVLQGLIFVGLLFSRYFKEKNISDLFLALILLLICYEQICYTIGFMNWYDVFKTTKINYFLIPMGLGIAPLVYLYVKAITTSNFQFKKKNLRHFAPIFLLIIFKISIYFYDSFQPGFSQTQNGVLRSSVDEKIVSPIYMFVSFAQMLLYLAFTFQLFYIYRKGIIAYFSNTYMLELNWILTFLVIFSALFIYDAGQSIIGNFIFDLNYMQRWWLNLFMALIVLFVGIKGYFTDTSKLNKLSLAFSPALNRMLQVSEEKKAISKLEIEKVSNFMHLEKPYLNPELNLSDLAILLDMNRAELSKTINAGFHKNFNDFINEFRVNAFKQKLQEGKHKKLSLLGIAYDCGFNSKATFNRVFKKIIHTSPSEYLNSISK